jgi:hypothetical protein
MEFLRISLARGSGDGIAYADSSIILVKALVFDDFRVPYGGAGLSLVGALVGKDRFGERPGMPWRVMLAKDPRDRKRRMLDIADGFLAAANGYAGLDDAFELIAQARLGPFSEPFAFIASGEPRRRFEAFIFRVERAGCLPEDCLSLAVTENVAAEGLLARPKGTILMGCASSA